MKPISNFQKFHLTNGPTNGQSNIFVIHTRITKTGHYHTILYYANKSIKKRFLDMIHMTRAMTNPRNVVLNLLLL